MSDMADGQQGLPRSRSWRWREWRQARPPLEYLALGLLVLFVLGIPFAGELLHVAEAGFASRPVPGTPAAGPLQIVRPAGGLHQGDGNLSWIEVTTADQFTASVAAVEIAIDADHPRQPPGQSPGQPAARVGGDPYRWRYLWSDPAPGPYRIQVRAAGSDGQIVADQSAVVDVRDGASTAYRLDNPYAGPGAFRKGQVHEHSRVSFDAWLSLPPAQLALAYKARGYQFVVMTDHDVVSSPREVNDPAFLAIPGYESTAESGHISGLFASRTTPPARPAQERIDGITAAGGLAVLSHPGWVVGWSETALKQLRGYTALEIYNGMTTDPQRGVAADVARWQAVLNTKGWPERVWAVAVDDAHRAEDIDRGWIMVKTAQLTSAAIKQAIQQGRFYASTGPSFTVLGVLDGAVTAASPEATRLRFFDQDGTVLAETPAAWGSYQPTGQERWIRVEAQMADGRTAWSQPFWVLPNAPRVALRALSTGTAITGQTLPGAQVYLTDGGRFLGSVVADPAGAFRYSAAGLGDGDHDVWLLATAPWPDHVEGPPTRLTWGPASGISASQALGQWVRGLNGDTPKGE
jgi:predicted metal-dependent phosphoesterase TrpH